MIIDAHAHTNGGNLGNFKAGLLSSRALARGNFHQDEEALKRAVDSHVKTIMDEVGTDIQFICAPSSSCIQKRRPKSSTTIARPRTMSTR